MEARGEESAAGLEEEKDTDTINETISTEPPGDHDESRLSLTPTRELPTDAKDCYGVAARDRMFDLLFRSRGAQLGDFEGGGRRCIYNRKDEIIYGLSPSENVLRVYLETCA